jgi:hypothetical protein
MSRMSELAIDIEERLYNGENPMDIAEELGIPYKWVLTTAEMLELQNEDVAESE